MAPTGSTVRRALSSPLSASGRWWSKMWTVRDRRTRSAKGPRRSASWVSTITASSGRAPSGKSSPSGRLSRYRLIKERTFSGSGSGKKPVAPGKIFTAATTAASASKSAQVWVTISCTASPAPPGPAWRRRIVIIPYAGRDTKGCPPRIVPRATATLPAGYARCGRYPGCAKSWGGSAGREGVGAERPASGPAGPGGPGATGRENRRTGW